MERRNAPFLEASRRSWKGGGAENGEERSVGTGGIKERTRRQVEVFCGGRLLVASWNVVVLLVLWWFGVLVIEELRGPSFGGVELF